MSTTTPSTTVQQHRRRRVAGAAAALLIGVGVVSGGVYSAWTSTVEVEGTITAADVALTVNGDAVTHTVDPAAFGAMVPGTWYAYPLVVSNAGSTPGSLTWSMAPGSGPLAEALNVEIQNSISGGFTSDGLGSGGWQTDGTLAAGETRAVVLRLQIDPDAAAADPTLSGQSTALGLTFSLDPA